MFNPPIYVKVSITRLDKEIRYLYVIYLSYEYNKLDWLLFQYISEIDNSYY